MNIKGSIKDRYIPEMTRSEVFGHTLVEGKAGAVCGTSGIIEQLSMEMIDKKAYLEIGTFDGVLISILAEQFPDKHFYAIDSFECAENTGSGCFAHFCENNKHLDNVTLCVGRSSEILPEITWMFDVIFIDGDHSYEAVMNDIVFSSKKLLPEGKMIFHDFMHMPSVKKAVTKFGYENKEDFKFVLGPGFCVTLERR